MEKENINLILIIYDNNKPNFDIKEENKIILINENNYEIKNKYFKSNILFEFEKYNNYIVSEKYDFIIFYFSDLTLYLNNNFILKIENIYKINQEINILVTFENKKFIPDKEKFFNNCDIIIQLISESEFIETLKEDLLNKIWKFNSKIENEKKKEIKNENNINQESEKEENFMKIFDSLLQFKSNKDSLSEKDRKEKATQLIMELADNLDF